MKVLLLNGPNLNMLGKREPNVYGTVTLQDVETSVTEAGLSNDIQVDCFQSNHEGVIIDKIHSCEGVYDGVIFNPGAFTHYSYAIRDAIASVSVPFIEVHISNVHQREEFRHTSVIAPVTKGQIVGFGIQGYHLALQSFCL